MLRISISSVSDLITQFCGAQVAVVQIEQARAAELGGPMTLQPFLRHMFLHRLISLFLCSQNAVEFCTHSLLSSIRKVTLITHRSIIQSIEQAINICTGWTSSINPEIADDINQTINQYLLSMSIYMYVLGLCFVICWSTRLPGAFFRKTGMQRLHRR